VIFQDRHDAGKQLAGMLHSYARCGDVVVLALPRGGVPVAFEVAEALHAPLDIFLIRKLGVPGNEEFAMGAVASGGVRVVDENLVAGLGLDPRIVARVIEREEQELRRRERAYRDDRHALNLRGRIAILVDDGIATGSSMAAAILAVRERGAEAVVVAVPIAARQSIAAISRIADEVACVATPERLLAVGRFYEDFDQTTDEEVVELLRRSRAGRPQPVLTS
jgi:predicted phosphoribosyltransferase